MLSKSAQIVKDALAKQGIDAKVVEFLAGTRTAEDAAKAINCQVAQIIKSLIFRTKHTNKAILVLVSGINRVNEKIIAKEVGEEIVKADADFTRDTTGFAIGGIPPVGHKQKIDTFIDEDLLQYTELWAAAGTPNTVFSLDSAILANLTKGRIIAVK